MRRICAALLLLTGVVFLLWASGSWTVPTVLYTDLDSGPNTGGEHGDGVYLTIYGRNFGATRSTSTVKIGGGLVASYTSWSDQMIVVEPGAAAVSGEVVVTVAGVASSSHVSFIVRAGNVYFVGAGGSNSNPGTSIAQRWLTLIKCRQTIAAGDTCYALDGYVLSGLDTQNSALAIQRSGTELAHMAIVAYPGATATIDGRGLSTVTKAIGTPFTGTAAPYEYWTIAKMVILGPIAAKVEGRGWRLVGNEMICNEGDGQAACMEGSKQIHGRFLGNNVHGAGCGEDAALTANTCDITSTSTTLTTVGTAVTLSAYPSNFALRDHIFWNGEERRIIATSDGSRHWTIDAPFSVDATAATGWTFRNFAAHKQYHAVYYSTDSWDVEIAYNWIHDNLACRGIQFHSSPFVTSTLVSTSFATPIVATFAVHPEQVTGERLYVSGVTGNAGALGTHFFKFTGTTTAEMYDDPALTIPTVGTGSGTGGTAKDGTQQFELYVHDNLITGSTCDGINFATVDPSLGNVWAWNNVLMDVGRGASDGTGGHYHPVPGPSDYAAVLNNCLLNTGPAGTGVSYAWNNTVYNAGSIGGSLAGAFNSNCTDPSFVVTNNIVYQQNGVVFVTPGAVGYSGERNLWWPGSSPAGFLNNFHADPLFVSAGTDFHLQDGSPAKDSAVTLFEFDADREGVPRPQGIAWDLGAYEIPGALPVTGRARGAAMRGAGVH